LQRWGRYGQSDPVGEYSLVYSAVALRVVEKVASGLTPEANRYSYGESSPLAHKDPFGLYVINDNCRSCDPFIGNQTMGDFFVVAGLNLARHLLDAGCATETKITRCMQGLLEPGSNLVVDCPQSGDGTRCDNGRIDPYGFAERRSHRIHICPRAFSQDATSRGLGGRANNVAGTIYQELAHVCGARFAGPDEGQIMEDDAFNNYYSGTCGN
jgi:hypothetical protein